MLTRCFVYFGVIALFVGVASIRAERMMMDSEMEDRANPAITAVAKLLGSLFVGAAAGCLIEAATACKDDWTDPGAALECGKNWLADNKGKCAIGK